MMKRQLLLLFFMSCMAWSTVTQAVTVSGQVLFGQNADPAPFYPVYIHAGSPASPDQEVLTDASGYYELDVPFDPQLQLYVYVLDFCTGIEYFENLPNPNGGFTADFYVCEDILPPPPPNACGAFFTYEQIGVDPYVVNFIDLSYSFDSIFDAGVWNWNFGDGATSTEQNPSHEYAATGNYVVTLSFSMDTCSSTYTSIVTVMDSLGCMCPPIWSPVCVLTPDSTFIEFPNDCEAICAGFTPDQFAPCDPNWSFCNAAFDFTIEGPDPATGYTVYFNNQSFSSGGDIILYEWHFGDGQTSNEANPVHHYPDGAYLVSLTITTSDGCTSSFVQYIYFGENCICPDYYDPVCVALPGGITFTFGNPCEAECAGFGPEDFVTCDSTGCICPEYYAPVCVMTPDGQQITFDNPCFAECAGFGPDDFVVCEPIDSCNCPAVFDPVCVVTDSIEWSFPNACYAICAGFGPDQFVACQDTSGCVCPDYYAPVCVVTPEGQIFTFVNECYAFCAGFGPDQFVACDSSSSQCYANFFPDFNPANPLAVYFNDASYAGDGQIISWYYTFGDGNASTEANPMHTYASEGVYEVSLTIVTSTGCTHTTYLHICVGGGGFEGPACQALFFFTQDSTQSGAYQFVDYSLGNITSWHWDFGDGTTSNEQFPSHVYEQPGVYPVTLTINSDDCTSTITVLVVAGADIWYNSECTALFVPFIEADSQFVFLLNLSSPDAASYHWDFGDGQTSDEYITAHYYEQPGVYTVTLTVTTINGCTNSYTATIDLINNNFVNQPAYLVVNKTTEILDGKSILAMPNPTTGQLDLRFNTSEATDYQVTVFNLNGQQLQRSADRSQAGVNTHHLDLSNLPSGIYGVRIQSGREVHTLKVVKE